MKKHSSITGFRLQPETLAQEDIYSQSVQTEPRKTQPGNEQEARTEDKSIVEKMFEALDVTESKALLSDETMDVINRFAVGPITIASIAAEAGSSVTDFVPTQRFEENCLHLMEQMNQGRRTLEDSRRFYQHERARSESYFQAIQAKHDESYLVQTTEEEIFI